MALPVTVSGVSLALVSGTTYAINGLAAFTKAEGSYTLTVNAAGIQDQNGNPGTGSLSTSWLMDTTPPTSTVSPLPKTGTSLSFPVTVTGTDPNGANGSTPSGIAAYTIYDSVNGGPWQKWTTITTTASTATATFTGLSNTIYAFYATATDAAGNVQAYKPSVEASTYLPNLAPPVTSVDPTTGTNPSSVAPATGTFTLDFTGTAPGGKPLAYFEVYAAIDAQTPVLIGPAIPAGFPDAKGVYHATITYQGLTDGTSHSYIFTSLGIDTSGLVQSAPVNPVTFTNESFTAPSLQVTALTVENGAAERSYVRYLDVDFNESDAQSGGELTTIADSIGTASPAIQLYKYDLNGDASSKAAVSLSGVSDDGDRPRDRAGLRRRGPGRQRQHDGRRRLLRAGRHRGNHDVRAPLLPAAGRRDRRRRGGQQRPDGDRDGAGSIVADGLHAAERGRQRRRVGHGPRSDARHTVQGPQAALQPGETLG